MSRVLPELSDHGWIGESIALAYAGTGLDWTPDRLADKLSREQGVVAINRERKVYGVVHAYEIPHDVFGVVPAGLSNQVKDLVPQHHNQEWIDGPICGVLADCLREIADENSKFYNPEALEKKLWAFVAYDLAIPYWQDSPVKAKVIRSRSGGNALAYIDSLKEALEKLEAAGL